MKRSWAILLIIIAVFALINGGKYLGMAILTALTPMYAILLASIFFIVFLITAAISVQVGKRLVDKAASRAEVEENAAERRKAA